MPFRFNNLILPDRLLRASWFLNGKIRSNDLVLLCFNVLVIFLFVPKDVVLWLHFVCGLMSSFVGGEGCLSKCVCACKVISVGTIDAQPEITGHCSSSLRAWFFTFGVCGCYCFSFW